MVLHRCVLFLSGLKKIVNHGEKFVKEICEKRHLFVSTLTTKLDTSSRTVPFAAVATSPMWLPST